MAVRFWHIQVAMETEVYIKLEMNYCLCNLVFICYNNWFNNNEWKSPNMYSQYIKNYIKPFIFLAKSLSKTLFQLVEKNKDAHFFLDEVPFGSEEISANLLNQLSQKIPENLYLWAACQAHEAHYTKELKGMECILQFRNKKIELKF
jgi:hypothetical protein